LGGRLHSDAGDAGFIEGLVCVTIVGQVPHLLGIAGTSGNFFRKLWFVLQHLPDASLAPVVTGVLSLAAMQLLRPAWHPPFPLPWSSRPPQRSS
jgi:MFS superfamily sulfate permease-like transporter